MQLSKRNIVLLFVFSFICSFAKAQNTDEDSVNIDYTDFSDEYTDSVWQSNYSTTENDSVFINDVVNTCYPIEVDSSFGQKYQGKDFIYTEEKTQPETAKQSNSTPINFNLNLSFLNVIFYIIIGAVVIYVLYFVFSFFRNTNFERNKTIKINKQISDEQPIEQIEEIDFETLINNAKAKADYNEAVRYYFLWYLKRLSISNYIKWHKDKTNFEYKNEIKNNAIVEDFNQLSYIFEWVWYRHSLLDVAQFQQIEKHFSSTINSVR